jgi:hypothetical protein
MFKFVLVFIKIVEIDVQLIEMNLLFIGIDVE